MNRLCSILIFASAWIVAALLIAHRDYLLGSVLAGLAVTVMVARESGVKL